MRLQCLTILLQEWEVLVLSKLNWNIPPVVAMDFVEHIVQVRHWTLHYQTHSDHSLSGSGQTAG